MQNSQGLEKKPQKTEKIAEELGPQKNPQIKIDVPSPYLGEYKKIMDNIKEINIIQIMASKKPQLIRYHPWEFFPTLISDLLPIKKNQQIFHLSISISYFTIRVSVYFESRASITKYFLRKVGCGSFASVFELDQKSVIKTIHFDNEAEKTKKQSIRMALQEYTFYAIASALEIGPKITRSFGFDLLIYKDSIEFTMEKCFPAKQSAKELYESLKLFHTLHIVHGDIKPANVMYSPIFKKNVFIDFNCSSIVQQEIGYKAMTSFKGTLGHCSLQMQKVWETKSPGYVDLYMNDLEGLRELQFFCEMFASKKKHNFAQEMTYITCFQLHLNLRSYISANDYEAVHELIQKNRQKLIPSYKLKKKNNEQKKDAETSESIDNYSLENFCLEEINITMEAGSWQKNPYISSQIKNDLFNLFGQFYKPFQGSFFNLLTIDQLIHYDQKPKKRTLTFLESLEGETASLSNCKMILYTLKQQSIPMPEIRRLYDIFLYFQPDDQLLYQGISILTKKLEISEKLNQIERMRAIDTYLGRKNVNFYLWKLGKFEKYKSNNFLFHLLLILCSIRQISEANYRILGSNRSFHLKECISNTYQKSLIGYWPKQMKFQNLLAYRLLRILKVTSKINQREMRKLKDECQQRIFLKHFKQKVNLEPYEQLINFLTIFLYKSINGLKIKGRQKQEVLLILDQNEGHKMKLLERYYNPAIQLLNEIKLMIENGRGSFQELKIKFDSLHQSQKEDANFFKELNIILNTLCGLPSLSQKAVSFLNYFLKETEKYFCSISLSELNNEEIRRSIVTFNQYYLNKNQSSIAIFQQWISQESLNVETLLCCKSQILSLSQRRKIEADKLLEGFSLFEILQNNEQAFFYKEFVNQVLLYQIQSSAKIQTNIHAQIIFDRIVFIKHRGAYPGFFCYFLEKKDYQRCLNLWMMMSAPDKKYHQQLFVQGSVFQLMSHPLTQRYLSSQKSHQFVLFYSQVILKPSQRFYHHTLIWVLLMIGHLGDLWDKQKTGENGDKYFQFLNLSLLSLLKYANKSSQALKNRLRENIGAVLQKFKLIKVFYAGQYPQHFINQFLMSQLTKKRMRLFSLRNSLFSSSRSQIQKQKKLMRKIRNKRVAEVFKKKFMKIIDNKSQILISMLVMKRFPSIQLEAIKEYFNSKILKIQQI